MHVQMDGCAMHVQMDGCAMHVQMEFRIIQVVSCYMLVSRCTPHVGFRVGVAWTWGWAIGGACEAIGTRKREWESVQLGDGYEKCQWARVDENRARQYGIATPGPSAQGGY